MSPARRALGALVAALVALGPIAPAPAHRANSSLPRALEPGFTVTPYAATGGTPSSLAFGPDTRDGMKGQRLYVLDNSGGTLLAIDDVNGVGSQPAVFADGFRSPLGVVAGSDGSVYVADAEAARAGPFGLRQYGRVWKVTDTDGDGVADEKHVVLKDLPNGRHNTNGLAFGPDGMLYVANGNSTDDGMEGGESEVKPWSGSLIRFDPDAKNVSITDLPKGKTLVAYGWRNVYDVAFSPVDPTLAFVPMNGADDAREGASGENPADPELGDSDDLLFATDVNDKRTDDFGFPSCLYNLAERGNLRPYDNPNQSVIDKFGKCPKKTPRPVSSFGLHTSSDGLAFQTTDAWGDDHRNDVYVAQWGNLFGAPAGHNVIRVELNGGGRKVVAQSDFLDVDTPLDLTFDAAGAMYVADYSGQIFKVDRAI